MVHINPQPPSQVQVKPVELVFIAQVIVRGVGLGDGLGTTVGLGIGLGLGLGDG
jgi:hypothetical protein